jgi:hypothetical protein
MESIIKNLYSCDDIDNIVNTINKIENSFSVYGGKLDFQKDPVLERQNITFDLTYPEFNNNHDDLITIKIGVIIDSDLKKGIIDVSLYDLNVYFKSLGVKYFVEGIIYQNGDVNQNILTYKSLINTENHISNIIILSPSYQAVNNFTNDPDLIFMIPNILNSHNTKLNVFNSALPLINQVRITTDIILSDNKTKLIYVRSNNSDMENELLSYISGSEIPGTFNSVTGLNYNNNINANIENEIGATPLSNVALYILANKEHTRSILDQFNNNLKNIQVYGTTYNSKLTVPSGVKFTKILTSVHSNIYKFASETLLNPPNLPKIEVTKDLNTDDEKYHTFFKNTFYAYHKGVGDEPLLFDHRILGPNNLSKLDYSNYGLYDLTKLAVLSYINWHKDQNLDNKKSISLVEQIRLESTDYVGLLGWLNFSSNNYMQEGYYKVVRPNIHFMVHSIPSVNLLRSLLPV